MFKTILLLALAAVVVAIVAIPKAAPASRVAVLQSLGQTAPRNGVQFFSEADYSRIIDKVASTGGDLAFGTVTDTDAPLSRIEVSASRNAYQKQRRAAKLDVFRRQVIQRLSYTRLFDHPNLAAAINRANLFFGEGRSTRQYLILIADGDSQPLPAVKNAHVLIVSVSGHEPQIPNARVFESVAAAIDGIDLNDEETEK